MEMGILGMPIIKYKSDRIQKEWESGEVNHKLVKIVEFLLRFLSLEAPEIKEIVLTCILRFQDEQDHIYLNHKDPKIAAKYKKKSWPSVHQYWRGADVRTRNWPKSLINKIVVLLNCITYDKKRPRKKTAKYHDVGTGAHIHIQTWIN